MSAKLLQSSNLMNYLRSIDHKGYGAYKKTCGSYDFKDYILNIEHVQSDPYAPESRLSIEIEGAKACFPKLSYSGYNRRIALQDFIIRLLGVKFGEINRKSEAPRKGRIIMISKCNQEILERTTCTFFKDGTIFIRFAVSFPAFGRTIDSSSLIDILFDKLPTAIAETCYYNSYTDALKEEVERVRKLAEDQYSLRQEMEKMGLVAFVADGSILPRESGISSKPMTDGTPFQSPPSMRVSITLPNSGVITGMGIKKGVALIVGGGYHGKSTLLEAIQYGVYNHIHGDGREFVITDSTATKIRSEDGRCIHNFNVSPFINNLPNNKDTKHFNTEDASGSLSQAAAVIESLESGSKVLLIDEDTSATNFMIRDELMQRVISADQEPIVPFISRIRELYEQLGVSTILVAGSSGSYFHVADAIIQMNCYIPHDITEKAKSIAESFPSIIAAPPNEDLLNHNYNRIPKQSPNFRRNNRIKSKLIGQESISIDGEIIELKYVEQLVDKEQYEALINFLIYAETTLFNGKKTLCEIIDEMYETVLNQGLEELLGNYEVRIDMALPRKQEIYQCFNRYRQLII